jgi:CRP-like cAMP-binding protein
METLQYQLPPVRVLNGLAAETLKLLSAEARREIAEPGSLIVREGESGNRMFLIETGSARVFKRVDDREVQLAVLGPGDCFGEGCILTTLPRVASVEAVTETVLYALSSMAFYRLYQQKPEQYSILVLNIARELSRRLRQLDESFAGCH